MKILLSLLAVTLYTPLFAQTQGWTIPNWDSINKSIIGTDYVPFSITTLDGKVINNAYIKGKVTFFSFWFKGCHPCLDEFDELNELYKNINNDTNIVFVAITFDKEEEITDILSKYNVTFPVACVPKKEVRRLNYNRGFPSVVLIDKQGKVRKVGLNHITPINDKRTITVDSAKALINSYTSL